MYYDTSSLEHIIQLLFYERIRHENIPDGYYKIFYNALSNEFLLVRVDFVIGNTK